MEILLVGAIVIFVCIYTNRINTSKFVNDNKYIFDIFKESDYEFLLYAKYGDRVVDPERVYMKRIRNGALVTVVLILVFISKIKVDELFMDSYDISPSFRFLSRGSNLVIILDIIKLEKHPIYYLTSLLDLIYRKFWLNLDL